ncbi:hypothetical protein KBD59_00225 [Candidatus Gracilibacteria bacterium]|nr:hypothetical protein [Candidatus Gracilibacteria bacterium]
MKNNVFSRSLQFVALAALLAITLSACTLAGDDNAGKNNPPNGQASDADKDDDTLAIPRIDTQAAQLRVVLNTLYRQHVNLASEALRASFDGAVQSDAAAHSLDRNSIEMAKVIGTIYGPDSEKRFLEIWRSHIGFFVDYTLASKKGDKAAMEKAVKNLGGYVDAIADFLSSANPNLPRQTVKDLVSQHITHLKTAIDSYVVKEYAKSYLAQSDADLQMGAFADVITGAVVRQFPAKYNK